MADAARHNYNKEMLKDKEQVFQSTNLHDYLKTLPPAVLDKLYNNPSACLAVFLELSEIAKHYIIRILFVEQPVPQAAVASWIPQAYGNEHAKVATILSRLRIWQAAFVPGGLRGWILNSIFQRNLRITLLGGGKPWIISCSLQMDTKACDVSYLDSYAMERWECVLCYMVSSQQQGGISAEAIRTLLHADLMKRDQDGSPMITHEGFQFLLLNTASQVLYFILQYLNTVEARGLDLVECLSLLLQLSFSTLGKVYSTEGMGERLLVFLQHLHEFGLVYQCKRLAGQFYPTKLALNVASGPNKSQVNYRNESYLIVETNYRVYAYTDSNFQVTLLGLFCELLYRFPNLAVGVLTRESVHKALKSGITAQQIIAFLKSHAHPCMSAAGSSLLPSIVVDQIKLWENECNRITFTNGVLYSQFLCQTDFEVLRDYAQELGVLVWQNHQRRTMVVTKYGHKDVKCFWKEYSTGSN